MGIFIAIEGGDGSGKGTQTKLLADYADKVLHKHVFAVSFPRHGEPSSYYADQYLNGAYGGINEIHSDLASLPYAIDRFAASKDIRKYVDDPDGFVVADRYVASNLAHQGTRFKTKTDRLAYYKRMMHTEYEILGIPRPTINIVLLVPSNIMQENVDKKDARAYTTMKRDIHEQDAHHLELTKANYEELCGLYPNAFTAIECTDTSGKMRSIEDIQQEIRDLLTI